MATILPASQNGFKQSTMSYSSNFDGASSRRVSGRYGKSSGNSSAASAQMSDTVTLLKRRCADELGAAVANNILSSYTRLMEWISNERLRRLPTEGSAWDKVLAWAQSFGEKFNDFDLAVESFTGGNYDGAEIAFGYCILLLELGEENAPALQTSFGFFFQRSLDLIALLDRSELFNVSSDITDQLVLGYGDLVTLVSDIALRFYQVIRGAGDSEVSIDIYTAFGSTIESFQSRRTQIVEAMWSHQLSQDNVDTSKIASIQTLRSWLSVDDFVLKYKLGDHTNLVNDRQELTCLWLQPYLTRFLNSNRDSLTITGGSGSGKSVLAGTIVDLLQKTATRRSYSVIFVQVDARIKTFATSLHVARSILFQFLEHRVGNVQNYKIISDAFEASQHSKDLASYESILWSAIEQVCEHSLANSKDTIIIVDGIDEVSEDPKAGQALLKHLKDASSKHEKVRLITLSQPSTLPANVRPDVDVNPDLIYDDVFAVVSKFLARSPHFLSRSQIDQDILVDKIVNASKGNILWAKMVTKHLVMEHSVEKLTQAIEQIKKSPKPMQDVIKEQFTEAHLSEDAKLLVYWLTIAERPLTVEELGTLYSTDPRQGTIRDQPFDVLKTLRPTASVVFLQDGLLYLRHTVIKRTLTTWFEQNKPVKEPALDFTLRLLSYIRTTIREQRDPSFTWLPSSSVDQRFHASSSTEYAIRYWPKHYLELPQKVRDISPELKKEFTNALPTSPTVALVESTTWTWLPAPTKISWHTTTIDLRSKVLSNSHPIVLQSVINLGRIFQTLQDYPSSADYFYQATQYSTSIFSNTHPLTVQCANYFLQVTQNITVTSRTTVVTHREEILIILIESYKKQYGARSEQVINLQRQLVQLYRSLKEEQKAVTIEETFRGTTSHETTRDGVTRTNTGSLGVRVKSRTTKELEYKEWDFSEDKERDTVIHVDYWKRIEELLALARTQASKGETVKAEQSYVEAWYYMSMHTRSVTSTEAHLRKLDLGITFAQFLKSVNRETESAALLTGIWEEYQGLSITRNEQVNSKFIEIAKVMKSVGLTTTSLAIFKNCSSVFRSLNKTESSSYKEVQEYEQATQKELLEKTASSKGTASHLSEEAVTEIFTYMESSKSTEIDISTTNAIKQIVSSYIAQHRYKECTQVIKRFLRTSWSSLFSSSYDDVTLTTVNTEFAISMVEQLIHCYRSRHMMIKAVEYREKLYHALRLSRKVDDKLVQHSISELFRLYEILRYHDKIIQLHRELLEEYKKVYGPSHKSVIDTLFTLAKLTSPEPVSFEYYRQIVTILSSKEADTCHVDAIEPLKMVAGHYWNERRYPGAVWAYSLLFRTYIKKGKELKIFHEHTFVSTIYNRYVASLRATTTDTNTIYQITTQYRKACIDIFGANHEVSILATLYLARVCETSKKYQAESISLFQQLLKESKASEYHAEINETLEAIYEEQSLEAARSLTVNASSEQLDRAISVTRTRLSKTRSDYGWAHSESLSQLKEMAYLYAKQSKKEEAYKELHEATREVVTKETSSASLIKAASTVAESYVAIGETHRGLEIAEELRWQLVTKDTSNSKKYNLDITKVSRSAAIYIAQLEYSLRQDTSTSFNEIYLSILTEIVYYEEFQRSIRSNSSIEVVFSIAARLHAFLSLHQRLVTRRHVEDELVSFFLRSSGDKAKVGDVAQVKVLVTTMLEYIRTHEVKDFVHSVNLASIEYVRSYIQQGQQKPACDLAQTAFRYVYAVGGYKSPSSIKYGLILAITIADVYGKGGLKQPQIQIAGDIVRAILKTAKDLSMNLAGIPLQQTNIFVTIFGEEKDYVSLDWFLTMLWESRGVHRAWKPAVVLQLGYRLVLARFLLGKHDLALQLATDIAYNLRRVYGATHLVTLEVNILLSQLCTSTGLAFQSQKGAEDIARRYYKRAIGIHENVLRSLTVDPLGLGDEDDVTVFSTEAEPMDMSVVVDKDANQGTYARKHMHLLKLALERFGGYPKGYGEYEAINADVFHAYPEELRGVEGLEKWNIEKFGGGKAESNEGGLDTNVKRWSLTEAATASSQSEKLINGGSHTNGYTNGFSQGQTESTVVAAKPY